MADYKDISFRGLIIGKIIFYGTPRAGKTTLRKQLLRNTENIVETCNTPESSTPIAEMCGPILIERILAQKSEEHNEWRWAVKKLEDIAKILLHCLHIELSKKEVNSRDVLLASTSSTITGNRDFEKPHIEQSAATTSATSISEAERTLLQTMLKETIQVTSDSSDLAEVQNDQSSLKIDIKQLFLDAFETGHWSEVLNALHSINNSMLLQVIDGGGQSAFQEIFPLLVSGPSVALIIFKLTDDLTEHYKVRYQPKDAMEHTWQDSYVVKKFVFHALSSVCSYINDCTPYDSKILLVGTHKDELEGSEDQKMATIRTIATSLRGWL